MNKKKIPCIGLDFDGTIADYSKREHLRDTDWKAYILASYSDTPSTPICEIIDRFKDHFKIIILSARAESSREETEAWLYEYNIHYDKLELKPNDFVGEDCFFKSKKIDEISQEYDMLFYIDDRPSCVKTLRNKGFYVLQCGYGY
jgi:uncharacterized HAD superfamily protein